MLVIRWARVCILVGEIFSWNVFRYLFQGSRCCVRGVVILPSTSLLRVIGSYVNVVGSVRPSRYGCVFEIWYFVRPKSKRSSTFSIFDEYFFTRDRCLP